MANLANFTKEKEGKWTEPFVFIQGADPQFGMIASYVEHKKEDEWQEEIRLSKQAVQIINSMRPKPKFLVLCGDLVNAMPGTSSSEPQMNDVRDVFSALDPEITLFYLPGNHDIGDIPTEQGVEQYRRHFGPDHYSFWLNGCHFVVLNSQYYENESQCSHLAQEQREWLDSVLKEGPFQHRVVFQHIPWFVHNPDESKFYFNIDKPLRTQMLNKFKENGVSKIFCGHLHENAGGWDDTLELVVSSAIGAQLGEVPAGHGFRIVKVYEDRIEHNYVTLDNAPTDISL